MNLIASLRGLARTLAADARLTRRGAAAGWYTRTYYRGRWDRRMGRPPAEVRTAFRVNGRRVTVCLTPAHLGAVLGLFADAEYDLRRLLPGFAPARVLDLGANAGMGTAYLHALYPRAAFACVEPDPRNVPLLERTLAVNRIAATVVPVAAGPESGQLLLRFGEDPTCSALETSPMHDLRGAVPVPVLTVGDILTRAGWDAVDLVKMDIEGSEKDLLGRNNDWLRRAGAVVLEIHPNTSLEEIGGYLRPYGFTLTRTAPGGNEPVYLASRR